ncbi:MAG: ribonuclease R [Deltaproteobacteria bacterium]|nr:ribonuclease R [Deltaproteobacteria bacterium]
MRKVSRSKRKKRAKRLNRSSSPDSAKLKEGYLKTHHDGYGFVSFSDPETPDVFVPKRRLGQALDGDKVALRVWKNSRDGRLEGEVEKILERGRRFLVGTLTKLEEQWVVEARSGGQVFDFKVDPADLKGAQKGESVGIEILVYPQDRLLGEAQVIQLFGARGEESTEIDIVILKHQLAQDFPSEVLRAADLIQQQGPPQDLPQGRVDLRHLPLVTIDGETARDFDDAICVQKEGAHYRLWVSIADVSHYVEAGSVLDQEALKRGTSVYFTRRVLPMLPEALSNDLCSLRPLENRLTMTAELLFDAKGRRLETKIYPSLICSQGRLTYTQVAKACLEEESTSKEKLKHHLNMLSQAFELFKILRKVRLERGSLDFDLPEPEFIRHLEDGKVQSIVKAERNEAHMLIEDFMIAANEAVADYLTQHKRPLLYRIHDKPDPAKLKDFALLCHNLGLPLVLKGSIQPKTLANLLNRAKNHPEEKLINHLLLRSLKQACYATKNLGHFGLASLSYCHFTSPIRRYPDLIVHRVLKALWSKQSPKALEKDNLDRVGDHCSRRERIAMEAEWEARDLEVALFMKDFVGQSFEGHISRVAKFGFFVELDEYFVEGLVSLESLKDDHYVYQEKSLSLLGRRHRQIYRIGKKVKVQVVKVDVEERKVYLEKVES